MTYHVVVLPDATNSRLHSHAELRAVCPLSTSLDEVLRSVVVLTNGHSRIDRLQSDPDKSAGRISSLENASWGLAAGSKVELGWSTWAVGEALWLTLLRI